MAVIEFICMLIHTVVQNARLVGVQLDEETRQRMRQREEFLSQQMSRLLQEVEQRDSRLLQEVEQSDSAWGALLFGACQRWQFWAVAAVLVLLFGLCWWLRKRSCRPASSSKEGKKEQKEKPHIALHVRTISAKGVLDLSDSFTMVEELVDELLRVCGKLSRNSFMPRLKPVIGVGSALGCWSSGEEDAIYRLLVPLKPPRGHTFHVEMGTATKDMPARNSRLRVELQCTCMKEPLEEDMLCFLHHPQEELRKNQGPSLLRTLCTGPYLDIDKTTRWFQVVVKEAWEVLPQSKFCHLTVLRSRNSCKLWMTHTSGSTILIDTMFGVKQGDSYTFLSTTQAEATGSSSGDGDSRYPLDSSRPPSS